MLTKFCARHPAWTLASGRTLFEHLLENHASGLSTCSSLQIVAYELQGNLVGEGSESLMHHQQRRID